MVECTALEMRHTCKGIVGSNPTLSATTKSGDPITPKACPRSRHSTRRADVFKSQSEARQIFRQAIRVVTALFLKA